jgi:hypothetical protein
MEKKLGLSIYPEQQSIKEMKDYLLLGKKYGFSRVFTSLLQITNENKVTEVAKMKEICLFAKAEGYEVAVDVAPHIFKLLDIKLPDLKFFHDLGTDIVRLDENHNGSVEAELTHNKYGMKIEINMSSFRSMADLILEAGAVKSKLIGCHNFYPQKDSALDFDHFVKNSKHYKKLGLRTAAFVTSQVGKIGP